MTAISGTGPAYLFFVVEAMIEAGVHLGLPRDTATELVVQTMLGSAKLLRETGEHPTVLRERVTSPAEPRRPPYASSKITRYGLLSWLRWKRHVIGAANLRRRPERTNRARAGTSR